MSEHTDKVLKEMGQSSGFLEHVERTLGWHLEHKRLGFADPIADLYEELLNEKAQLSEENATFEQKAQQTDYISRQAAIDFIDAGHLCNPNEPRWSDNEIVNFLKSRPSAQPEQSEMIKEIRKWINSGNRGTADYFIVDKIEEIINKYE